MFDQKFDLELQAIFDKYYFLENDLEEFLVKLKEAGASQTDSIRVLMKKKSLSLSEADQIILHSECWSESKESTISLRNEFYDAFTLKDERSNNKF
ncbi:MAG: hypothetical protein COZ18_08305 [Flexibacter sp. CG_4_10_14_3_um_filter_32_15]|nr:MAG: hypothetical protein COZ18_08305 [Flexibacter sp. CG_4_10_14_3_um_filter_32_15]